MASGNVQNRALTLIALRDRPSLISDRTALDLLTFLTSSEDCLKKFLPDFTLQVRVCCACYANTDAALVLFKFCRS